MIIEKVYNKELVGLLDDSADAAPVSGKT